MVDAACASSLSAIHLAALELESGRTDMVLSGGLDAFNDIFMYMCFSKTPALSASGNAQPFNRDADGTILGEGIGVVVLKRLADAECDGDRIYAVIKGLGSSSDGKGQAVYTPSSEGQARALRAAYRNAGVSPSTVELVEAHGTGTRVGDATEVGGLTTVYREASEKGTWCALGSVKSMIGHTKAAAGAAGLIKAAMALHHKILPPTIKVESPNEAVAPGETPFYVNTEKRPWLPPSGHPRRAGISAFGFGGSNFHCVVEEYESPVRETDWDGHVQILAFSADDRGSPDESAPGLRLGVCLGRDQRAGRREPRPLQRDRSRAPDPGRGAGRHIRGRHDFHGSLATAGRADNLGDAAGHLLRNGRPRRQVGRLLPWPGSPVRRHDAGAGVSFPRGR